MAQTRGTLKEIRPDTWLSRIYLGRAQGKIRQSNKTFAGKKKAAENWHARRLTAHGKGSGVPSKERLFHYLTAWLEGREKISEATREKYANVLRYYVEPDTISSCRLCDLEKHHVQAFVKRLSARGLAPATIKTIH